MNWYSGGIEEAVRVSKQKGSIFVVYVEGADEKSEELTQVINSEQVSESLQSDHFVAIKIVDNSVSLNQFRQIYKQVTVPSIFFIGKNGVPLEIITGPVSVTDFLEKLNQILVGHGVNIASKEDAVKHSENLIKHERENANKNQEVVCENGVCTIKPTEQPSTSKEDQNPMLELTPEDKVERAKELVNITREAKQAQEKENERLKEIERRKVGQDVQKLKKWQQENDLKELVEERNKEKMEQKAARERVLNQIAQDKAERAAKFATSPPQPTLSSSPASLPTTPRAPVDNKTSRLQFRLPDGSSYTHEFSSSNTLQDVHNYILGNVNLPFQNYTLSTTFPRREFTANEVSCTLLELKLTPTAVILILPTQGVVAANPNSWLLNFIWSFIGPFLNFMGYLKNKIMGGPSSPTGSSSSVGERKRTTDSIPESSSLPKRHTGETSVIRRQGNIHRLADNQDSDDENNTWNGNSTQQM